MSLIQKYTETYGLTQFITCRVQFLVIPLKDSVCVYVGILYVCVCVGFQAFLGSGRYL